MTTTSHTGGSPITTPPLRGLVAATFTPMLDDGTVDPTPIPKMVDQLIGQGVQGLYILGSTGEGLSLTYEERCTTAEHFIRATNGRIPVIVQVGSESLAMSRNLAAHAQAAGATAVSAVSPVYFKPMNTQELVDSMALIASGAPDLPFYYYHIPMVTGVPVSAIDFLKVASEHIPNLRGIKFTSPAMHEFQACLEFAGGKYDILWGMDEALLAGLAAGARGAVGSTYNFCAPIYVRMLAAWEAGDIETARLEQSRSQAVVRTFVPYGPRAAQKAMMSFVDLECGPSRLPIARLESSKISALREDLRNVGFFDWGTR